MGLGFSEDTTLILILRFQKWSPPGLACDCGFGVLAMLSRIFRFCGLGSSDDHHPNSDPGISEMVTPGPGMSLRKKNALYYPLGSVLIYL